MNRLASLIAIFVMPARALAPGGAQQPDRDSVSAPIRDVRYDVTFMRANGGANRRRRDELRDDGSAPVVLSLPAWTPGAYEISNFARWVDDFAATSERRHARSRGTSSTTTRGAFARPARSRCA